VAAKPEKVDETPASGRPWGVVGGLVGVAGLMGVLTFVYWRHTKPEDDDWYGYDDGTDPDGDPSDPGPYAGPAAGPDSEGLDSEGPDREAAPSEAPDAAPSAFAAFEPGAAGAGAAGVGAAGVGAASALSATVGAADRQSSTVDLPTEAIDAVSVDNGASPAEPPPGVALAEVDGQPEPAEDPDESLASAEGVAVKPAASSAAATAAIFSSRPTVVVQPDPDPEPEPESEPEPEPEPGQLSMDDLRRRAEAAYERQSRDLGAGTKDPSTGNDL